MSHMPPVTVPRQRFKDLAESIRDYYSAMGGDSNEPDRKVGVPQIILEDLDTIEEALKIHEGFLGNSDSELRFGQLIRQRKIRPSTRQSYFNVMNAYTIIQDKKAKKSKVLIRAGDIPHFAVICENAYNTAI